MSYEDKNFSEEAEKILRLADSTSHRMNLGEIKGATGLDREKIKSVFEELESKSVDIERPESVKVESESTLNNSRENSKQSKGYNETNTASENNKTNSESKDQNKIRDEKRTAEKNPQKTTKDTEDNTEVAENIKEVNERVQKIENKVEGVIDRLDTLMEVREHKGGLSDKAKTVMQTIRSLDGNVTVEKIKRESNLSKDEIRTGYNELKSKGKV